MLEEASSLSAPALAVLRATESGCGLLTVGRYWVLREGFVATEGDGGGWHLRYFVVSGHQLEYFKEETVALDATELTAMSIEFDQTNVITSIGGTVPPNTGLAAGDVVIGINGASTLSRRARDILASTPSNTLRFTILRPKGHVALQGASVAATGPRKHGGGVTVTVSDVKVSETTTARRSKYTLVVMDERACAGWIASIKEAIAAAATGEIKNGVRGQSLALRPARRGGRCSYARRAPLSWQPVFAASHARVAAFTGAPDAGAPPSAATAFRGRSVVRGARADATSARQFCRLPG